MSETSILIVEDEAIVAENLRSKLERLGYAVAGIAGTGAAAVEMALEKRPRLVLMDIQLGGQSDGIQTAETIQAGYDVPVIYLTAHSDPATLSRAKLTGPFGYIIKPFDMRDLATQIELALYKHQTDRQLRDHREWLRVTLTSIGDAVIAADAHGRITFLNPVAETLTGWRSEAAMGQPVTHVFRIINERSGQTVENPVSVVLRERRIVPLANHTAIITKTGRIVPIEDSAAPIESASGEVLGVVLVFHDVTDKRRTEEEQQHLRTLMAEAEKMSNVGAWEWDLATDRWTFSDQWLALHGCTPFSLRPNQLFSIAHPADRPAVEMAMQAVRSGVSPYDIEHRIVRVDDGQVRHVHAYGRFVTDDAGRVVKIYGFTRDITEFKQAETARKASIQRQALLATVAERLLRADDPQVIVEDLCRLVMRHLDCQFFFNYLVEESGRGMRLNAYAGIPEAEAEKIRQLDFGATMYRCVDEAAQAIIAADVQHSDDPRTTHVKGFGATAYCCHPLIVQDRLIGTLSFGTHTRTEFSDDEVALIKSVCDQVAVAIQRLMVKKELHDLNQTLERRVAARTRLAEARSRQLQALAVELIEAEERERQRVADHLHDDLQQMLAAARFQLETVCQIQPVNHALSDVKQLIEESIDKSRRLSHDLSPPVLQHANLDAALEWIARHFGKQFGLQVELHIETAVPFEGGPLKIFLFRAAQELLFNVVKHSRVDRARLDLFRSDGALVLTVSDKGRGLDPHILDSAAGLTGLGLLSLRERAHYIGGNLTVESAAGQGSRFTLTVPSSLSEFDGPRHVKAKQPPDSHPEKPGAESESIRVLFVDDHKVMRQGLINLIGTQPGIHVVGEASNGREAIDRVERLKPDMVIMDVSMPDMDGIEATRRIKAKWPQVRVIALSMVDDDQVSRTMREAGAEAFVSKTASSTELLKAIYGLCSGSRGN